MKISIRKSSLVFIEKLFITRRMYQQYNKNNIRYNHISAKFAL